jgi:hypothetical protein
MNFRRVSYPPSVSGGIGRNKAVSSRQIAPTAPKRKGLSIPSNVGEISRKIVEFRQIPEEVCRPHPRYLRQISFRLR